MNKKLVLFLAIFLLCSFIVYSVSTFTIQETERISLEPNATDPDSDKLSITYSLPFNEKGEWQTDYGDAGEYTARVTASDGITNVSEDVLIIVKKKEESPKIESVEPKKDDLGIKEAQGIQFKALASDLNKDELSYQWLLDDKKAADGQEFYYDTTYGDSGEHKVAVVVSDGAMEARKEWDVKVENVDIEILMDDIKDLTVNENEVVRLNIPNFKKYSLEYSISEPLGNKNEWKTTYNDSGAYSIEVHAAGKGFDGTKFVVVAVKDVDRPPVFDKIENKVLNEGEKIEIVLSANDPDGDEVSYSADNLPAGAKLEGNVFTWETSYDTIKKEGIINWVMDKFRVLSKSSDIQFIASSKDSKAVQDITITVKDVNRAPVLEDIEPITISEGETLKISPKAYDPDGDKVSLSYSGFINTDTFKSGCDDAGTYYVKASASDGLLETSKFAQINIKQSNREPAFGKIGDIKAREGDNIAVVLNAYDSDGDEIKYSIDNPPDGSSIKGNIFLWTPSFDLAGKKEAKKMDLVFAASDGKAETRQVAKAEISDKNRPPKIVDATRSIVAKVNEPALMFVNAIDDDSDELAYTWDFGFFEKYKATSTHQRTFTSRGTKIVKVIVSDGIDNVEQIINVNVV